MSATIPEIEGAPAAFESPASGEPGVADLAARFPDCLADRAIYSEHYAIAGRTMWVRPVDAEHDQEIVRVWMNREHVIPYWNMAWPLEKIRKYLDDALHRPGFDPFLAYMDDEPFAYFEAYDPGRDRIRDHYETRPDDVGLHILIGEEKYLKRFIIRMSISLMRLVFGRWPACERVVGEPDENNKQVLGLMRFLGFQFSHKIQFPEKTADFLTLTKRDFERGHGTGA